MNLVKRMTNENSKRMIAILLLTAMLFSLIVPVQTESAYAASNISVGTKVNLKFDHTIRYGIGDGGYSNLMMASGINDSLENRYVFCIQPHMQTPTDGQYAISKIYTSDSGEASVLRKLVYYAKGYPGWSVGKSMWFNSGDWSDDDIYGIFHIAMAYVASGYDDNMPAWMGGTVKEFMYTDNWNKMIQIVNDCKSDSKVPKAPKGFNVFYISESGCQDLIGGTYESGTLKLLKKSANTDMTNGNTCYSLKGAEFGVYDGSKKVATLVTDASGVSNTVELGTGTYVIKEDKVPQGYAKALDQTVTVKSGTLSTVTFTDYPKDDPIGIILRKGDAETGKAAAQGKATLEGAVYEIKYYKHDDGRKVLDRTWRVVTDKNGIAHLSKADLDTTFDNDEFYYSSAGDPCFPLGTVTIQEVKAPTGYLLNDMIYTREITAGAGTVESVYSFNAPEIGSDEEVAERVKRGDLELIKVASGTMERLAGVPFKITSLTTGENHVIVTDENGYASTASSWNKHTSNTNRGQTSKDGIWFGPSKPDNSKGALIYDDYMIEELSCEANKGMNLLKFEVSIYKDSETVDLGTLINEKIEIGTIAKDEGTDSHIGQIEKYVYIKDTVKYSGLTKGKEYKLVGSLIDKDTESAINVNGKAVIVEKAFTPKHSSGEVEVEFKLPGETVRGKSVVVFEELYLEDMKIAMHADIKDEGQTVYYPDIKTLAKDSETSVGVSNADSKITIVDTVSYSGLMPNKEYTLVGKLMDKATNKPLIVDGKKVTAMTDFTPQKSAGTVNVTFTFDTPNLEGKSVVVFETLKYHNKEVAAHADINADGQTVYFPKIGTMAKDTETQIGVSKAEKTVKIIDTVSYEGLRPNLEYTVTGVLMNKETNKPLIVDGEEVCVTKTFMPEKSIGNVDVTFTIDGTSLEGMSVVVYETLKYKETELAVHADINDNGQTVYFPKVKTEAKDTKTNNHIAKADEKMTIIDIVSYKNLRPGVEYKVKGILMDKETGKPIMVDNEEIVSEKVFTPKDETGTVEMTFEFDGIELEGKTIVVFEELYYENISVAVHADINDNGQSIYVPKIKTSAKDSETKIGLGMADKEITLIDTVTYNNLMPGAEYKVIGKLMDKETGKAIKFNKKEVTSEATFVAETPNGTVDVKFVFNGENLAGRSVVVFESLLFDDKEVATHADIKDDGQTVSFPKIETTAKDTDTNIALSNPDEEVTIVDVVSYKGLRPGLEYKVTGILMNKETNKPLIVDGMEVTSEAFFTPETEDGTVEVSFKFNGEGLKGQTVVAFEFLSYKDVEVAVHTDIKDEKQSVSFPKLKTIAKDKENEDKIIENKSKVTIIDTVEYEGLIRGEKYTVKGILMDKATGKPLLINDTEVVAEKTFVAKNSEGSVELEFTFDASNLEEIEIVVFEKIFYEDIEIGAHEDINDMNQTVRVIKPEPIPETGDNNNLRLYLVAGLGAVLVGTCFAIENLRRKKK